MRAVLVVVVVVMVIVLAGCERKVPLPSTPETSSSATSAPDASTASLPDAIADTVRDANLPDVMPAVSSVAALPPPPPPPPRGTTLHVNCPRDGPIQEFVGVTKAELPKHVNMRLRDSTDAHWTYVSVEDEWDCRLDVDFTSAGDGVDRVRSAVGSRKRSGRF